MYHIKLALKFEDIKMNLCKLCLMKLESVQMYYLK